MQICMTHETAYTNVTCPACDLESELDEARAAVEDLRQEVSELELEVVNLNEQLAEALK